MDASTTETLRDVFLPTGVTLGSGRSVTHTEGGLLHNSTANTHTGTVTLTSGGSTYVLSRIEFDRSSRGTHQIDDNVHTTVITFDGANRTIKTTDAEGNFIEPTYDKNSNVVQINRTEKAQSGAGGSPAVPDEIFITKSAFDVANRQVERDHLHRRKHLGQHPPPAEICAPLNNLASTS
jgi:YD repeat-containing protein